MGVIRPPWVSKKRFSKSPFNYCDHFGDQMKLAKICKICKNDIQRRALYKKLGKDPDDMTNVSCELLESFKKINQLIEADAKRLGIDLTIEDTDFEEEPDPEIYAIFRVVRGYVEMIDKVHADLRIVLENEGVNEELILRAGDVLAHSRYYCIAKIGRALFSRLDEGQDPPDDLADSKTSAFLAYIGIQRNVRALLALSEQKSLSPLNRQFLQFAKTSMKIADVIQEEFFPDEVLTYEEYGCEEYEECFNQHSPPTPLSRSN